MDWRESIALVHKLCDVLKAAPSRATRAAGTARTSLDPPARSRLLSEQYRRRSARDADRHGCCGRC